MATSESTSTGSGGIVKDTTSPVGNTATATELSAHTAQKKVNTDGPAQMSPDAAGLFAQLKATGNRPAIGVIETILKYLVDMAPGKMIAEADGARCQATLFRALQTAINLVEQDFQLLFATILKIVDEHSKGCFGIRHAYRFSDVLTMSTSDRHGFARILNLMSTAAPVAGRNNAMKQVDMIRSLEYGFTEAGKRRVLTFFNK